MGRVYKRGRIWWLQYYRRGDLFRESSRSPMKSLATAILRKREGVIADGRLPALQAEKTRFEDLKRLYVQDYEINGKKSLRRAKQLSAHLAEEFQGIRASEITSQRVQDYISHRLKDSISNATINRELAALKRMFRLASQQTPPLVLVTSIPHIPHLREDNVRTGFFTEEEYKVLRAALPDHLKVTFIIAYWTGMRAGEILGLQWDQVDLEAGLLRLEPGTTKNGRGRMIPLVAEAREVLRRWRDFTLRRYPTCAWVCHYRGKRMERVQNKTWDAACAMVGLEAKLFHDLRRTAIRNMVKAGISERVAMAISGHRTRSVFDRYNVVAERDILDSMQRLETVHSADSLQVERGIDD